MARRSLIAAVLALSARVAETGAFSPFHGADRTPACALDEVLDAARARPRYPLLVTGASRSGTHLVSSVLLCSFELDDQLVPWTSDEELLRIVVVAVTAIRTSLAMPALLSGTASHAHTAMEFAVEKRCAAGAVQGACLRKVVDRKEMQFERSKFIPLLTKTKARVANL